MTSRRYFLLAAAGLPAAIWKTAALAQVKQAPVVIGWLSAAERDTGSPPLAAFKEALAKLGWKEGSQFVIEVRWANGELDRLRPLAEELASKKPTLIVATSGQTAAAATKAAAQTPIVQATGTDPVSAGLATSLARPGGMVTGLSNIQVDVTEKFLEFLLAAAPKLRRVGFLADSKNPNHALNMKSVQRSATRYTVDARIGEVARNEDVEPAISRLAKEGVEALVVLASPLLTFERHRIIKLSLARRWPMISTARLWAEDGALLSYGVDALANFRRAAFYVDRILKGAKPGDLPIEQPTRLELVVNRKSAKAIGITIPESLILQADRVIE